MPQSLSDSELISAIINNDEKAFNELFERHWSRVYAVAFKYVRDEEQSLEIAHDIFLNIWNKRHQLQISSFQNYVLTAGSYHAIRKRQQRQAIPLAYVEDMGGEASPIAAHTPVSLNEGECNLSVKEIELKVNHLLNDLPKRCREIYLMSRHEQLTISEIAERLNISKRTVENQLTSALKHLRTALEFSIITALVVYLR